MSLRVSITPAADRDIDDLFGYIAQENLDAAVRFLDALHAAFNRLAEMPEIGTPQEFENPLLAELRMWPIKGFDRHLIFYRTRPDRVEIVRVLYASRDIEALFEE